MSSARTRGTGPAGLLLAPAFVAAVACGTKQAAPAPGARPAAGRSAAAERFDGARDAFLEQYLARSPVLAASLGLHRYDGQLPDPSARGLGERSQWLKAQQSIFEDVPAAELEAEQAVEREVILARIRGDRFDLEVARWPLTNPASYLGDLSLAGYVARDYAPLADRARAVMAICGAAAKYLGAAQANLQEAMPRAWIEGALEEIERLIEVSRRDVAPALAALGDPIVRTTAADALQAYAGALAGYRDFLRGRLRKATDDAGLGAERFLQRLVAREGLTIDLARLRRIGEEDLAHNLAILELAARAIDPKRPVAAVVEQVAGDKPEPEKLLAEASAQIAALRTFVVDKGIASVPAGEPPQVRAAALSPRDGAAVLRAPGPLEERALPSFYEVGAPDPSLPRRDQLAALPSRAELFYSAVHEVWPGRFVHELHRRQSRSRLLRALCVSSAAAGWAHYAEQVMQQAGAAGDDPKLAVGQLTRAIRRDVRFLAAIGLHGGPLKLRDAAALFEAQAFADRAVAREEAARASADPGVLDETLGVLLIRKLHDDWAASAGRRAPLRSFHDRLLSLGCAPLPAIRRAMLGPDAGPPL